MITINWDKHLDFDAQVPPPGMREVILLRERHMKWGNNMVRKQRR